jgi:hydroxyacylglutathione hydrolase
MIEIHMFPCLQDNYGFLIHDTESGATATVDTPEVGPIEAALAEKGWSLTHILNTHHHFDHAGGNEALKKSHGCIVVGPAADAERIPGIDVAVADGEDYEFGTVPIRVFDVPGHTRGHIAYYLAAAEAAFVGDTIFALGCGRLFEGTPEQMWGSIQKLMGLPDATRVYCAHEYTQSNARFAVTVDPDNTDLIERAAKIDELRAQGIPTVPTTIGLEKATNPFLRPEASSLRATLGMQDADAVAVFAETRRRKDSF